MHGSIMFARGRIRDVPLSHTYRICRCGLAVVNVVVLEGDVMSLFLFLVDFVLLCAYRRRSQLRCLDLLVPCFSCGVSVVGEDSARMGVSALVLGIALGGPIYRWSLQCIVSCI